MNTAIRISRVLLFEHFLSELFIKLGFRNQILARKERKKFNNWDIWGENAQYWFKIIYLFHHSMKWKENIHQEQIRMVFVNINPFFFNYSTEIFKSMSLRQWFRIKIQNNILLSLYDNLIFELQEVYSIH